MDFWTLSIMPYLKKGGGGIFLLYLSNKYTIYIKNICFKKHILLIYIVLLLDKKLIKFYKIDSTNIKKHTVICYIHQVKGL